MKISNAIIADCLRRYATVLGIQGADRFKLKAYRRAAQTIEAMDESVTDFVAAGHDLKELPGIGQAISEAVQEIVSSGRLDRLERILSTLPAETAELSGTPRLDPKRVARVYKKLGISSLVQLRESLESGRIREAFDSRMEFHIREGLDNRPRHLLWNVQDTVARIEAYLRSVPGVIAVSVTGSFRRKTETVGDLNFLVSSKTSAPVFKQFAQFSAVQSTESISSTKHRFHLSSGVPVTVQWIPKADWAIELLQSTGSASHVDKLIERANSKSVVLHTKAATGGKQFGDEQEVYAALGLSFVEPELREGRGEVAAAERGELPTLITVADIVGDLHMHTTASDGANSIEEMAHAARERGYQYIAITDHSQSLKIANGLSEARLRDHIERIDEINSRFTDIRILKSAEVDILADGTLDYSDEILERLDLTICSIHSRFAMNREKQTERLLRAMDNPHFTVLGHATGRLLLSRPGYEFDVDRIIKHAKANGCFFEINSSPNRLDLSDHHARMAKDAGVKIAINTDAHSISELGLIEAGINQARRAWLTRADVLNARALDELMPFLRR